MNFKNDILIIYSTEENIEDSQAERDSWIDQFMESLKVFIDQVRGSECSMKIVSSEAIKNENDLSENAMIVPVITNQFLESKNCIFALEEFIDQTKTDVKTSLRGYDRIFPVSTEPFERHMLPPKIIENHLYKFYEIDLITDLVETFVPVNNDGTKNKGYWFKMNDLVQDLSNTLNQIKSLGMSGGEERLDKTKVVYLAETGEDMEQSRDYVMRDLQSHGYKVLPEKSLEINEKIIEERIKKDIENADFSIHIIGNEYGRIPADQEVSVVELQNRIATERAGSVINQVPGQKDTTRFHKIIWVNADPQEMTIKQKNYIEEVLKEAEHMDDAEILRTPIEELRQNIRNKLRFGYKRPLSANMRSESKSRSDMSVYIISHQDKVSDGEKLAQLVEKEGYKSQVSTYDGEIINALRSHKKNLVTCDAAIIFFDNENPDWLNSKIKDLIKSPGLGRKSQLLARGVVSTGNSEIKSKYMDQANVVLIESGDSSSVKLGPFFEKFEAIK